MNKTKKLPLVLCIMDGWGLTNETKYNSVHLAKTPYFDELLKNYPSCKLEASGALNIFSITTGSDTLLPRPAFPYSARHNKKLIMIQKRKRTGNTKRRTAKND